MNMQGLTLQARAEGPSFQPISEGRAKLYQRGPKARAFNPSEKQSNSKRQRKQLARAEGPSLKPIPQRIARAAGPKQ